MVSTIAENRYPEYISIKHLGMLDKGEEIYSGPQVDPWAPSFENYTLNDKNGATEFVVEMTSPDEYKASFDLEPQPSTFGFGCWTAFEAIQSATPLLVGILVGA